jgi:drug/metabolite transporter (DMT)-like permease
MEPWILATLGAALAQTVRFALQKRLAQAGLSAVGATWARFLWSAPLIGAGLALWMLATRTALPPLPPAFWGWALAGGLGQILATICVVALFRLRHFAVGITFKKSEVLQTAALGWLVLGEALGPAELACVAAGTVALVILSAAPGEALRLRALGNRAAGLGLLSGAFFALAGVGYRGATLALEGPAAFRAALALALVTAMQAAAMALWLLWRDRAEARRVLVAWRPGLAVGVASLTGSFGWFVAFALQTAALVYALGQVELVFSIIGGALLFGERLARREALGIVILMASLVALVLVA